MAEQRRQRDDGQNRQHEKKRVRFWFEFVKHKDQGDEHQQPQQRVVADFFQELFHLNLGEFDSGPGRELLTDGKENQQPLDGWFQGHYSFCSELDRVSFIRLTTVKKTAADQPHIRIPVSASTPPTRRHSAGRTRSP